MLTIIKSIKLAIFEIVQSMQKNQKQKNYQNFIGLLFQNIILKKKIFEHLY